MRTSLTQTDEAHALPKLALPAFGRAMTRCECAGISFVEIARLLDAGEHLPKALERTGIGEMCTACRPDLEAYLARRSDPD